MANRLHLVSGPAPGPTSELLTFLIADVRGYTAFTQRHGDEDAASLARKFAAVAREEIEPMDGRVVELRGDEALAVFRSPRQALRAAVNLQQRFAQERQSDPVLAMHVGVGLDAGEAVQVEEGFRGGALNLASRLCAAAGPDQILASQTVAHLARRLKGLAYVEREAMHLKGFDDPVQVVEVVREDGVAAGDAERPTKAETRAAPDDMPDHRLPRGGFLGSLPEGPLVGRGEEMQKLGRVLDALRQGGRLVLLAGEPGVGKTRLAQEVSAAAHHAGYTLAPGICYQQQQVVPYYPFRQALATLLAVSPAEIRPQATERWPQLGILIPELGAAHLASHSVPEDQAAMLWAVEEFVLTISQTRPVVLALDDLQWADDSSLGLLAHLARKTRTHPVLILGTYRKEEVDRDHPLAATLLDLHRQHLVEQITVQRLAREDARAMVAVRLGSTEVDDGVTNLIYDRTEGNPFFIQEVVRTLLEAGKLCKEGNKWVGQEIQGVAVPDQVRTLIEQRLAHLGTTTQQVLAEAAILGQAFSCRELQLLTRHAENEVDAALDEAIEADLLRESGRDSYAFGHALVHQAIIEAIPPRRRRRLHSAAATMIEESGRATGGVKGRASELAWHFLQADEPDRAFTYAVLAGDQAARVFAHAEAERLYRMALEIAWESSATDTRGQPAQRALVAHALESLGDILRSMGRLTDAIDMQEQAAQAYEDLRDVEGQRRVVARIGSLHADQGTIEEGMIRLRPLFERAEAERVHSTSQGLALLLAARSQLLVAGRHFKEGLRDAERAAQIARQLSNEDILGASEVRRAEALTFLGRHDDARALLEAVVARVESGDQATLLRAFNSLAITRVLVGDLEQARQYLTQALAIAVRLGDQRGRAVALLSLSRVSFMLGDWRASLDTLSPALEATRVQDVPALRHHGRITQGYFLLVHGDVEEATAILQDELTAQHTGESARSEAPAQAILAERDLLQGAPELARDRLEPLLPWLETSTDELIDPLRVLARVKLACGDVHGAESLIDRCARLVAQTRSRLGFAEVLWIRGMVRAVQHRPVEAVHLFEAALSLLQTTPFPFLAGRILMAWGMLASEAGAVADAHLRLESALDRFQQSGALAYAPHAQAALRALDSMPGPSQAGPSTGGGA